LFALVGCGLSGIPASQVTSFRADLSGATQVQGGLVIGALDQPGQVSLHWQGTALTGYALSVSPSEGVEGLPSGELPVSQQSTTLTLPASSSAQDVVYTIILTGFSPGGGPAISKSLTVTVGPGPAVASLTDSLSRVTASEQAGNASVPVTLSWQASNASGYQLTEQAPGGASPQVQNLSSSASSATIQLPVDIAQAAATYRFTLRALGNGGYPSAQQELAVRVDPVAGFDLEISGIPSNPVSYPTVSLTEQGGSLPVYSAASNGSVVGLALLPGTYTLAATTYAQGASGHYQVVLEQVGSSGTSFGSTSSQQTLTTNVALGQTLELSADYQSFTP
jgi:hypothetical protein